MEEVTYTGTMKQIKAKVSFMREIDGVFDLIIKKHRNKRSLDANSYMWALIVQLANLLGLKKEEVYVEELRKYSQSHISEFRADVPIEEFLKFSDIKYYDIIGNVKHDGLVFTQVMVYQRSSEMNSKEMSILLDGVIADAEEQGIPTLTQEQVDRMKGARGK